MSSHSLSYLFCFLKDLIPDLELSLLLRLACPGGGQATSGDMLGEAMTVSGKSGTAKGCFGPKQTQMYSTTQQLCFSVLAEPTHCSSATYALWYAARGRRGSGGCDGVEAAACVPGMNICSDYCVIACVNAVISIRMCTCRSLERALP